MQVTFQLTADDYRDGIIAWRNLRFWRRWLIRALAVFMGLIFLVSVLQVFVATATWVNAVPGIALSVGFLVWIWAGPGLSARRQHRNTPTAHTPITIDASDTGLHIQSAHTDSQVVWSAYIAWGEYKSVFVILPQPRIYVPIPKRAFTPEQVVEFRELLRRNIQSKS